MPKRPDADPENVLRLLNGASQANNFNVFEIAELIGNVEPDKAARERTRLERASRATGPMSQ
jgi:hypothetical protein